jgi:hypothetical protein
MNSGMPCKYRGDLEEPRGDAIKKMAAEGKNPRLLDHIDALPCPLPFHIHES